MTINLKEILELQRELDFNIETKHNINKDDVVNKKKLAFIVELCEMINVNRCFKFWSVKNNYDREKLGDEFVDCLHFILSLSLYYKMEKTEFNILENNYDKDQLTDKILDLIKASTNINDAHDCEVIIIKLFELCKTFDFTWKDIIDFYKKKNDINHQRQKDNY